MEDETPPTAAPPAAPPAPPPEGPKGKTYSQEQVNKKLQGQGTEIDRLKAELAKANGTQDELLSKTSSELLAATERLHALETADKARVEAMQTQLTERRNALPESIRDLFPVEMISTAPDIALGMAAKLESRAATLAASVGGLGANATVGSDGKKGDAHRAEYEQRMSERLFGKKDGK